MPRRYFIKRGITVQIARRKEGFWWWQTLLVKTLTEDLYFTERDIQIDPGLKCKSVYTETATGKNYAEAGVYGFLPDRQHQKWGWELVLIPRSSVEVLDA